MTVHSDSRKTASERQKEERKKNWRPEETGEEKKKITSKMNEHSSRQKYFTLASKPVRNFRSFDLARTVARSPTEAACTT